ncbi:hypothetical protein [Kingella negevensis]|uniref:hypothetical protein n=1 Tax=Kingella negevensis TaxID=1522312 RepID=UPI00050A117A|nr:hypothetical protein [Kingella negevensis]
MQPENCLHCQHADLKAAADYYGHRSPHAKCKAAQNGLERGQTYHLQLACMTGLFERIDDEKRIGSRERYWEQVSGCLKGADE